MEKKAAISEQKTLGELLSGVECQDLTGSREVPVSGISADSRELKPGDLFVAVRGLTVDGHQYIDRAIAAGCAAVLVEKDLPAGRPGQGQPVIIRVKDSRTALCRVAANFYGRPADRMRLIAITGTNGKTTTSYLVEAMLRLNGARVGVIGTVNYRYQKADGSDIELPAPFTTPEAPALQRLLREMADEKISHVVMEVSSHALAQQRLVGLFFDVAVFTNLTRDHLDFHGNMQDYFLSKCRLFHEHLKPEARAVILLEPAGDCPAEQVRAGADGCWGRQLAAGLAQKTGWRERLLTCGLDKSCDIHPLSSSFDLNGIATEISTPSGKLQLKSRLIGEFNLKNLLAAVGIGLALGQDIDRTGRGLEKLAGVPGRLERVASKNGTAVFVDYAHTPDALENVLATLRALRPERLVCVFGCGGDRDAGKRPMMGRLAGMLSDIALATSDNPRSEEPARILSEIEAGLRDSPLKRMRAEILFRNRWRGYDLIVSRRQAIRTAINCSGPGDVILISGKGHETYQIIGRSRNFFDDRREAAMQDKIINW